MDRRFGVEDQFSYIGIFALQRQLNNCLVAACHVTSTASPLFSQSLILTISPSTRPREGMTPRIPTIAEIRASTEVLSPSDASATVVKVGENFAVKFGHTVSSEEAEAFQFISSNTKVPVPEFYATLGEVHTWGSAT
ncbi:phosphotransferase enzyme family [Fusarium mundagurra]|uniref:Phosphotransferase enzyme family n=1 Tax=Fusarium mundagurra TaxID=1567541 RepID=A0A8H6D8W7_9HYPO|nr:phosphotransferase enzyme family [Fusarium mundagurra]